MPSVLVIPIVHCHGGKAGISLTKHSAIHSEIHISTAALNSTGTLQMHTYFACIASLVRIKGFMGGLLGGDGWGLLYRDKQLLVRLSVNSKGTAVIQSTWQ